MELPNHCFFAKYQQYFFYSQHYPLFPILQASAWWLYLVPYDSNSGLRMQCIFLDGFSIQVDDLDYSYLITPNWTIFNSVSLKLPMGKSKYHHLDLVTNLYIVKTWNATQSPSLSVNLLVSHQSGELSVHPRLQLLESLSLLYTTRAIVWSLQRCWEDKNNLWKIPQTVCAH